MSHRPQSFHSAGVRAKIVAESALEAVAVDECLAAATVRHFPRAQSIYPQGAQRSSLFIVLDGVVSMSVLLPNGQRILCAFYQPGTLFGFPMVERERPRWSAADAFTAVTAALVPRREFERVLNSQPPHAVTRFFNRVLERQARFSMRLVYCVALDLRGRLALTLLDLATAFGTPEARAVRIQLPISHENLAEMVGASRERISKAMALLQAEGLIRYTRQTVAVSDVEALRTAGTPSA